MLTTIPFSFPGSSETFPSIANRQLAQPTDAPPSMKPEDYRASTNLLAPHGYGASLPTRLNPGGQSALGGSGVIVA